MDKLILINKENPWKEKYEKNLSLVTLEENNKIIKIDSIVKEAYLNLKEYLHKQQIEISINKAYENDNSFSEYQTGLAIDLNVSDENNYSTIHKVLKEYGFILRYPKEKENITGYEYNQSHIRYVGKQVADIIEKKNYTLEEYKKYFSAIIIVNKKKNMTSFDVVKKISNIFGIKRVGHTGTLDPMAEGILIVCLGEATKICELLTSEDKEYIATIKLGIETDTLDLEGKIIRKEEVPKKINIEETLKKFQNKTYLQEVPIYSAVKVNGKKLYEYARKKENVELPKKSVTIKELELLEKNNEEFKIRTKVTKGCYIRSLVRDIGKELNTPATMTSLLRTKQGNTTIDESYTLDEIENSKFKYYSIEEVLTYPTIVVKKILANKISNGVIINNDWNIENKVLFKDEYGNLLGIYEKKNDKLVTWKNFAK